jgi:hypothetical protein
VVEGVSKPCASSAKGYRVHCMILPIYSPEDDSVHVLAILQRDHGNVRLVPQCVSDWKERHVILVIDNP